MTTDTRTPAEIAYDAQRLSPAPIAQIENTDAIVAILAQLAEPAERWATALDTVRRHPAASTLIAAMSGESFITYMLRANATVELDVTNGAEPSVFFNDAGRDGLEIELTTLARALPDLIALVNHPTVQALLA